MTIYLSRVVHVWEWEQPEIVGVFATEEAAMAAGRNLLENDYPLNGEWECVVEVRTVIGA